MGDRQLVDNSVHQLRKPEKNGPHFDVKNSFDDLSEFYDSDELRFFLDSAKLMVGALDLNGVKNILDVATGTGHTAIELSKRVAGGRIIGIDSSGSMLKKAKIKKRGLSPVEFRQHDMRVLELLDGTYDLVTCSFGTYFLKDTIAFFKSAADKLRAQGKIALLGFAEESLAPYGMEFVADLEEMGFLREFQQPSFSSYNARCVEDLTTSGFKNITLIEKNLHYAIREPLEWWKVVWGTALRGFLEDLSPQNLELFKDHHLKKIEKMIREGTNVFKVNVLITIGTKSR